MADWRSWAITVGVLLALCGLLLWSRGGGPFVLGCGILVLATALLERTYGNLVPRPRGRNWSATDERFIDPETGKLVTVWFDPATGERRYVSEGSEADRPA